MILEAETSLLIAVRDKLIESLGIAQDAIQIELDDEGPSMSGQTFYAVSPNQASPGRYSGTFGAPANDLFGVRVAVMQRMGNVPKDRKRQSAFLDRLRSTNTLLSEVSRVLRQDYDTINAANDDLTAQGIDGKFVRPLVPTSVDNKPRMATADIFDAGRTNTGGNTQVVMIRGINFSGAEFIGKMVEQ